MSLGAAGAALRVGVTVHVFKADLMEVSVAVLGAVGVHVLMFMRDVVVFVGCVRVRMS